MLCYKVTAIYEGDLETEHGDVIIQLSSLKTKLELKKIIASKNYSFSGEIFTNSSNIVCPFIDSIDLENKQVLFDVLFVAGDRQIFSVKTIHDDIYKWTEILFQKVFSITPISMTTEQQNVSNGRWQINGNSLPSSVFDDYMSDTTKAREFGSVVAEDIELEDIKNIDLLEEFKNEIERINKNKFKSFVCHPVMYLISDRYRRKMVPILIKALYNNNRLLGKAINKVVITQRTVMNYIDDYYELHGNCNTFVAVLNKLETNGDQYASKTKRNISIGSLEKLLDTAYTYSNNTLTIFSIGDSTDAPKILEMAKDAGINMVSLIPKPVNLERGMRYLNSKAKEDGFGKYRGKELKDVSYSPAELEVIYEKWRSEYLIKQMGYSKVFGSSETKSKAIYKPVDKLNNMIGLTNVKEVVNNIVSYFKMQKEYLDRGISTSNPCRHMIFYGNPGTCKTTVARLLATILKETGIITKDKIVEAGRSDLVAEYVGHTALKTKAKIKEARGGILFIDEAYSLVDYKAGMFGDEAINTLVQEMENIREDTIIILAGYPDKMEHFLDTNPGLRSRIGFHVRFDNYSLDELMQILSSMAKQSKFTFTKEALDIAREEIKIAMGTKDFGNGRFVRSLLEQAMMKQASRVSKKDDYKKLSNKELLTINHEDIDSMNKSIEKNKMGFLQ